MTDTSDPTRYPPPDPERIELALRALHARRAKLRRVRALAVSSVVVVIIAATVVAAVSLPNRRRELRVTGQSATTAHTAASATNAPTTTRPPTSTAVTTTTTSTLPAPRTQTITYQPFTTTGALGPHVLVAERVTGTCLSGESSHTFRCFGVNPSAGVYDPCFAGVHGTAQRLVCPKSPTNPQVVAFTATSVTNEAPVTTTHPWAMQLASGQICLFVSAAWGGLGPYDCQANNSLATPADCRQPQPGPELWSTECQDRKTDASPFTPTEVTKVWF